MNTVPVQPSASNGRSNSSSTYSPRLLPFVGRSRELERVADFLQSTILGNEAALLWLQGEAGVGKSRFLDQVQQRLSEENNLVLYVRLYPDSASSVVLAFGSAIAAHPRLRGLLPNRPIKTLTDLTAALQRTSRLRPTLLIIDDVHLLDIDSAAEMVDLVEALSTEPIGIICSSRPGTAPAYRALYHRRMRQLELGPLNYDEVRDVLSQCYGEDYNDDGTLARIFEATHGIPLIIRAAMTECLYRNSGSLLYLEPTVAPPPGFHAKARFATEALVSCLMSDLNDEERKAAETLALLGEVFSVQAAAELIPDSRNLLNSLLEQGIITPALGQPQPLLPGTEEKEENLMAFAHTLLHEHLTSIPGFPVGSLLGTLESGAPLYSIHPLLRAADTSAEHAERTLRMLANYVELLADSINRLLATPVYNAAVSLYERHFKTFDDAVRQDLRLGLLRLRLQITSHIPQHPEFESTLNDLLDETLEAPSEAIAAHRLGALEFASYRYEGGLEEQLRLCLDESEAIVERYPALIGNRRHLRLLGTIAGATRACPTSDVLSRIRTKLETLLNIEDPEILTKVQRRDILIWVAAPILSLFTTPEDLDDRRELAARIEEEFGAVPRQGRLLSLWPQFLEASGEMTKARLTLEDHIIAPFKGYNLPEELSLRMLALSADAALGRPLRNIEKTALDILEETSELFPGAEGEQTRRLIRSSVSAYILLIGILRGSPGWSRRVITLLCGEDAGEELHHYLPFEQAAVNGDLEMLRALYENNAVPDIYRPLVYSLLHISESSTYPIGAIRNALSSPIFRRQDILRLHVTIGLAGMAVTAGTLTPKAMRNEIRPALTQGLEWCATHSLPGYLEALLKFDQKFLRKKDREEWQTRLAVIEKDVAILPMYHSEHEELEDPRVQLIMVGKIGYRNEEGILQRISGARARHVLGLLTARELTGKKMSVEEFRQLATGMSEADEGANYLRIIIARLRRILGNEAIVNVGAAVPRLNLEHVRVDAIEADRFFRSGMKAVERNQPREAFSAIESGLKLIGNNTLLPTLYDDIFEDARREFEVHLRDTIMNLLDLLRDEEDDEQAIRLLRIACKSLPHDEELAELLSEMLYLVGNHVEAWGTGMQIYDIPKL